MRPHPGVDSHHAGRRPSEVRRWHRSRPRMAAASAVLAAMLIAGLWIAGLVRFSGLIPETVVDPDTATDAIVVLTGGSQRVVTGLHLLTEDKAGRVLISGVHPAAAVPDLLHAAGTPPSPALQQRIDAGYGARDTAGNAAEAAGWMRARGYHSLRLVTGSYHMPRSLLEFRCALPDIRVIPHPVFSDRVQKAWWLSPGTAALIIGEYNKYLFAQLHALASGRTWGACG